MEAAMEYGLLLQKHQAVYDERSSTLCKRVSHLRYLLNTTEATHLHECFIYLVQLLILLF